MPIASSALLVLSLAGAAGAQQPADPSREPEKVNVDQLPLDVSRIQRKLQKSVERQEGDGLNLKFFVAVYAQAPPIRLFTPLDNLLSGPVPYGAPTHRQMMDMVTPREYRPDVADFSSIMRWLADKAKK